MTSHGNIAPRSCCGIRDDGASEVTKVVMWDEIQWSGCGDVAPSPRRGVQDDGAVVVMSHKGGAVGSGTTGTVAVTSHKGADLL